jgi:MFS family permease
VEGVFLALFRDLGEVYRLIRRDRRVFHVMASVLQLAVISASIYVLVIVIVQSQMRWGTKGIGFLGGTVACGMIPGSFLIGTFGSRWDKRQIILLGYILMGSLMAAFARSFTFVLLAPLAFVGGMILAPIMISQDTLLHETVPAEVRGRIFSTRDLILNITFALGAVIVAIVDALLPHLGARNPERVTLFILGALILLLGLCGEALLLRRNRARARMSPKAREG